MWVVWPRNEASNADEGRVGGEPDEVGPVARARPDLVRTLVRDRVAERHLLAGEVHRGNRDIRDDQVGRHRRDVGGDGLQVVGLVHFVDDVVRGIDVGIRGIGVDDDVLPHGGRRQLDVQAGVVAGVGVEHGIMFDRPQRQGYGVRVEGVGGVVRQVDGIQPAGRLGDTGGGVLDGPGDVDRSRRPWPAAER